MALASCRFADLTRAARCGALSVPENPDKPGGRRLSISVVVNPARHATALADPIVVLDQRGTGRSGALPCTLYSAGDPGASLRDMFPIAAVKRCAQRLETRADLAQYTFDRFANDLEQVRRSLGYGTVVPAPGAWRRSEWAQSFVPRGAAAAL